MLIQFTKKVPPYNAGEQAGFPEAQARRFISLGAASAVPDESASADDYAAAVVPESPDDRMMKSPKRGRGKGRK